MGESLARIEDKIERLHSAVDLAIVGLIAIGDCRLDHAKPPPRNTVHLNIGDESKPLSRDVFVQSDCAKNPLVAESGTQTCYTDVADGVVQITNGIWKPTEDLRIGRMVKVARTTMSWDDLMKVELKADLVGTVAKVDDDGDALINFPALGSQLIDTICWISRANFDGFLQLSALDNG